jgi:hypothetical protein
VLSSLSDHDGHSPFWTNKQWAAWASLYDFHDRALAALGEADPFTEVMHGSRDIGHAWRACARRRITLQRTGYDLNDVDNFNGMLNTLHPLMEALGDAAERLVAWDGAVHTPPVCAPRYGLRTRLGASGPRWGRGSLGGRLAYSPGKIGQHGVTEVTEPRLTEGGEPIHENIDRMVCPVDVHLRRRRHSGPSGAVDDAGRRSVNRLITALLEQVPLGRAPDGGGPSAKCWTQGVLPRVACDGDWSM